MTSVNEASNGKYCKIKFDIDTTEEVTLVGNLTTSARTGKYFSTVKKPTLSDETFTISEWDYSYTDCEGNPQTGIAKDDWKIPNTSNCKITAKIEKSPETEFKVTLFLNGGTINDQQIYVDSKVKINTKLSDFINKLPITPPTDQKLEKWHDEQGNNIDDLTSVTITQNRAFYPTWVDEAFLFSDCSWEYINEACVAYEESNQTDDDKLEFCRKFKYKDLSTGTVTRCTKIEDLVGQTKTLTVNDVEHTVRVIGVSHDTISSGETNEGKYTALTFEFANYISDNQGYSLATTWDGDGYTDMSNNDYLNSNVFYSLQKLTPETCSVRERSARTKYSYGKGSWYRREGATISTGGTEDGKAATTDELYANKSVWEMIYNNEDDTHYLTSNIKKVLKTTTYHTSGPAGAYTIEQYNCKLFLPTPTEMKADTNSPEYSESHNVEGSVYNWYDEEDQDILKSKTIKKQVNNSEVYTGCIEATGASESKLWNHAGKNESTDDTNGGRGWIASPFTTLTNGGWRCHSDGSIGNSGYDSYSFAYAIAPCFCL